MPPTSQREDSSRPLLGRSANQTVYNSIQNVDNAEINGEEREDHHFTSGRRQDSPGSESGTSVSVVLLAVLCVACFVIVRVLLPMYSESTLQAGADCFTLLFYTCVWCPFVMAIITILYKALWDRSTTLLPAMKWRVLWLTGAMSLGNGFCSSFAGLPDRTQPYLQGLLMTTRIPYTVLVRFVVLRKGLSIRRLGCTIAVLIGLFITVEPQIWSLPGSEGNSAGGSTTERIIWPMIFALGFLPAAINTVISERELKQGEAQSLSFMTWTQVFQLVTVLPLFWVDFIPFFGMAKSFDDFGHRMKRGFGCSFSSADDCYGMAYEGWLFIMCYCLGYLFQFLLIQRAEGAVLAVVVQSMVTPLATLFWTFFKFDVDQDHFYWDPEFTETTGFTIGGLLIIVPAVVLYNVFSRWDAQEAEGSAEHEDHE